MDKTYDLLVSKCLPFMWHYQNDLLEIDQRLIASHPGVPFFHWTRDCGTHIAFMHEPDWTGWPAKGVKVPYLFGHADREHILRGEALGTAEYLARNYTEDKILVHWVTAKHGVERSDLKEAVLTLREITKSACCEHGKERADENHSYA